ncbi:probable glutathione S-transferase GSTF2 [Oryza glaberrima]|uniref:glutathione transferase n=2 Tax=Oryza TaxID=4527 RepID=A0A0D3EUC6_9ORYZ|nr:probable glutathione S-transferase GSTF2 [Oryza glaberrima]
MAPMKLYGSTLSWNVTRCVAVLEEAGAEYEIVPLDFSKGEHKAPDHLARNPFGQVPALQDGDLFLWESRAICKYVCRKNKPELLKDGDLKESAMVDVWLEVESNQYTPALNPILFQCLIRPMLFGAPPDEKVVEENLEKLKKVLEVYEARLTKCKYLAGDYISVADLSHVAGTVCLGATPHASVLDAYPHVKAWWTDLMARPSSQKVASLMKPPA